MPPTATNEPVLLFIVWHRPGRGSRWQVIAQTATRAEALDCIRGKGDFRIAAPTATDKTTTEGRLF